MPKNENLRELPSESSLSEILSSIKQIIADDVRQGQEKNISPIKKELLVNKSQEDNQEDNQEFLVDKNQENNDEILDLIDVYKEDDVEGDAEDDAEDVQEKSDIEQKTENLEDIIISEDHEQDIELDYSAENDENTKNTAADNPDLEIEENFDLGDIGFFDKDEDDNEKISTEKQNDTDHKDNAVSNDISADDTPSPNITSSQTDQLVGSTFKTLSDTLSSQKNENSANRSIESLVNEMLRPMMQKWLDQNLPQIVEKLVKEEISRLVTKAQK